MYGMEAYLMIMYEIQKSRLAGQVRKGRQKEKPSPTGSPRSAMGKCICETNPKEIMTCT